MKKATIRVDTRRVIGPVDPRIFGGFVEHLGRAIYGGLYDPGSAHADSNGWRSDVLVALRRLDFTILRYPGGNFVSGYHWRDGIGSRSDRRKVLDQAWNSVEPNLVGTDEFLQLSGEMGWQPMLTANLGTGDADEAADWVRHCAEQDRPVKIWCLGNEMDGEWQIGHVPAEKYVERARHAASAMLKVDPELELVACGSSNPEMPTWLKWDRTVLEGLHAVADYISLHRYATNFDGDSEDFLAIPNDVDRQIESIDRLCQDVAEKGGGRRAYLCFDEWNVWYRTQFKRFSDGRGGFAPRLIEEVYNLEDALVVAGFLNSFVRHADVVRIANLAQIVNAIAPILTIGDQLLIQSIFWPFEMFSRRRHGISLEVDLDSPSYTSRSYGQATVVDASVILDGDRLSVFAVNRSAQSLELQLRTADMTVESLLSADCVDGPSLRSSNSIRNPDVVTSRDFSEITIERDQTVLALPAYSFVAATFELS